MLLAAYMRERKPNDLSDIDDKMAECSGDELGETVSSSGEPIDMTAECSGDEQVEIKDNDVIETPRNPELEIIAKKSPICTSGKPKHEVIAKNLPSDIDNTEDSDDELAELVEKKKRLEREKETLSDDKLRRRAERDKLKAKLKNDVQTLESEVAELSIRHNDARRLLDG